MQHGRLPWLRPDELSPDQRALYDKVATSPRATSRPTPLTDSQGRLNGPFNAMLTNPGLGDALQAVGTALRGSGTLPRVTFEMIVLIVAVERGASYEWYAHEPLARVAGLTDAHVKAIRERRYFDLGSIADRALIELVQASLRHEQPDESSVREVEAVYGVGGVTQVVMTVAFYDLISTLMRTWDSPLPEGVANPLA